MKDCDNGHDEFDMCKFCYGEIIIGKSHTCYKKEKQEKKELDKVNSRMMPMYGNEWELNSEEEVY
jgi:hypothetical protein